VNTRLRVVNELETIRAGNTREGEEVIYRGGDTEGNKAGGKIRARYE